MKIKQQIIQNIMYIHVYMSDKNIDVLHFSPLSNQENY